MDYSDKMISRLEGMKERYQQLTSLLMDPNNISDSKQYAKLGKEQALLEAPVSEYEELTKNDQALKEAKELSKDSDPEIMEMAKNEIESLEERQKEILDRLEMLLIPKDPNEDKDAIMEIRGAVGGDEALVDLAQFEQGFGIAHGKNLLIEPQSKARRRWAKA